MTQRERLENEIKKLNEDCGHFRSRIFYTQDECRKSHLTAAEWVDLWQNRSSYMINEINLLSVEPKREHSDPCLRFIIRFEDDSTEFIDVGLIDM